MKQTKKTKTEPAPKKKSRWGMFFAIIGMILLAWLVYAIIADNTTTMAPTTSQAQVEAQQDPLTPEERAKIKKQADLMEREIILTKEKEKLDAEYKARNAELNKQFEEIRAQKLSFK